MRKERSGNDLVAVTGIGMVTPLGITTDECWENMLKGHSGIKHITRFDASDCLTKIGGEIPPSYFEMEEQFFSESPYKERSWPVRLSIYCAIQAMNDAGLGGIKLDLERAGVITGSGGSTFGDQVALDQIDPKCAGSYGTINTLAATVSSHFDFRGPSLNVATACASGAFAVCYAYDYLTRGGQVCIAIGIDTILVKDTIDGFNRLMALSEMNDVPEKASRPFDKRRDGFVLSEGACAIVLESYNHACKRGARIYAVMSGHACTSEAFNIIAPEPSGLGMARTMEMAIERARIPRTEIGYINAHGTSTPHNDAAETRAIKRVFGDHAYKLAVSSQKSMIGHSIGAAGTIEFAVTALTLYHQVITPTINYEYPDPECDLDYVPNEARRVKSLNAAITNSFGFGGHNSSIILERFM